MLSEIYALYVETTHGSYYCEAWIQREGALANCIKIRDSVERGAFVVLTNGLIINKTNLLSIEVIAGFTLKKVKAAQ